MSSSNPHSKNLQINFKESKPGSKVLSKMKNYTTLVKDLLQYFFSVMRGNLPRVFLFWLVGKHFFGNCSNIGNTPHFFLFVPMVLIGYHGKRTKNKTSDQVSKALGLTWALISIKPMASSFTQLNPSQTR